MIGRERRETHTVDNVREISISRAFESEREINMRW